MPVEAKRGAVKLSIVILCWNDRKVIGDCLRSIFNGTRGTTFEVIVSDNGSTDGSIEFIRKEFPQVRVLENGMNLRFAKGNNVGIRLSQGEYVLILNPDTIIHEGTLEGMVAYADSHPNGGAFGCRILNRDGTYQRCQWPPYTLRSAWCAALHLGWLARISEWFQAGAYAGWNGETERSVGWLAGCFILIRGELLKRLEGFDEQFFYFYEDTDLCRRIREAGYPVLYTPDFTITHLQGQSTINRFTPVTFALDAQITRYRYYYKYYGPKGARSCRRSSLIGLFVRRMAYAIIRLLKPSEAAKKREGLLGTLLEWNYRVDPVRLVECGEEPDLGIEPANRVLDR
jgi:GT2 family glycosyltransferase